MIDKQLYDSFLQDVNVLETEIEHIKMVLSIVHHKLAEFHSLLKAKLGSSNNPDIAFIIDGIYEVHHNEQFIIFAGILLCECCPVYINVNFSFPVF